MLDKKLLTKFETSVESALPLIEKIEILSQTSLLNYFHEKDSVINIMGKFENFRSIAEIQYDFIQELKEILDKLEKLIIECGAQELKM